MKADIHFRNSLWKLEYVWIPLFGTSNSFTQPFFENSGGCLAFYDDRMLCLDPWEIKGISNIAVLIIFLGLDKFGCLMYGEYRGLLSIDPANSCNV